MKGTFTALDVAAMLKMIGPEIIGCSVKNIYDLTGRTLLFKLQARGRKPSLLVESGVRLHLTTYERARPPKPSGFVTKLRKHLRESRVAAVQQLGIDRVVLLTFASREGLHHLYVELYDQGNVVLLDSEMVILATMRRRVDAEAGVKIAPREVLDVASARNVGEVLDDERIRALLPEAGSPFNLLLRSSMYGKELAQHALLGAGVDGKAEAEEVLASDDGVSQIAAACREADGIVDVLSPRFVVEGSNTQDPDEPNEVVPGYIILLPKKGHEVDPAAPLVVSYVEGMAIPPAGFKAGYCIPHLWRQFADASRIEFTSFDVAVDAYFSCKEMAMASTTKTTKGDKAEKKIDKARKDQLNRVAGLAAKVDDCTAKAQAIEVSVDEVEQAILIIRSALENAVDWEELGRIVKEEQRRGEPIACLITKLKLESSAIALKLPDPTGDEGATRVVDIDVTESAYANAQEYYAKAKAARTKHAKSLAALDKAMDAIEKRARAKAAKAEGKVGQSKVKIQATRKALWFEKFNWFVSSERFMVVSGRDAHQNELLVKRYLDKHDIYVHADIHGAASLIIKNPSGGVIPPNTLAEAGCACVSRSAAWSAKIVSSAWWVYAHQVSKTAPSGEYLSTGSFMIRGKKNFLPPNPLVMGYGIVFRTKLPVHAALTVADGAGPSAEVASEGAGEVACLGAGDGAIGEAVAAAADDGDPDDDSDDDSEDEGSDDGLFPDTPAYETPTGAGAGAGADGAGRGPAIPASGTEGGKGGGKRRITAKERKLLRKARKEGRELDLETLRAELAASKRAAAAAAARDGGNNKSSRGDEASDSGTQDGTAASEVSERTKRRKRNKLKKMMAKYADQDDEERRARMRELGHSEDVIAAALGEPSEGGDDNNGDEESGSGSDGSAADETATIVTDLRRTMTDAEREAIHEKQRKKVESEVASTVSLMQTLVGNPASMDASREGDENLDSTGGDNELLYALVMCGPWSAFSKFKYKVKLVPGDGKKGKAARAAVANFMSLAKKTPGQLALIKSLKDNDLIPPMLGGVEVQIAGGGKGKGKGKGRGKGRGKGGKKGGGKKR
ncbi:serologically defined colon cancer antigen 1 [Thecamonas trahens ATCC 50062]|uniref:Ribosome quality control complex subunit 2 n=1 Tax=Thecamonas trahens ATCC 50062 TaxID=461836 RepID=A0A0L0DAL6_THETB|nr:serologically defined colon cancer antigen 1 [Thecamonas trahens ATCC 50062]KNC49280.1 serologically defined colon cancer antigen 1 [Thecamonas trahens ATCC 50062]|eukprot:XP_013757994.1 serologically defined colon cancer antigen 1 [Thecamonas trahens ATCC 50062]